MCIRDRVSLVVKLLSRFSRSNAHVALLSSGLGALRAARRARDVILRTQIEMRRAQNRRKTCPNELSACFFEVLEVSETRRSDQESLNEVSKSPNVTIHRVVIMGPAAFRLRRSVDGVICSVDVVP